MKTAVVMAMSVVALLFGCDACHAPVAISDTSDPTMWADADDPCAAACSNITAAGCTVGGQLDNPACAPQCRNDQASAGAQFPVDCLIKAGANRAAVAACGATCP